ncbi:MAG: hypothetical protein U1G07_17710 [Verrucomicrobiota bacterium]
MPTDGADFGRMKACYGKAYAAARDGADDSQVAEIVALGLERDIRRDGGSPAFVQAVGLLVRASESGGEDGTIQLLDGGDSLNRQFADWSLTRNVVSAAQAIGVAVINRGGILTAQEASECLLTHLAQSRCCDNMIPYLTRNRTHSVAKSQAITGSIATHVAINPSLRDLAARMLNASDCGLPPRVARLPPIDHSASALNEITLGAP